MKPAFTFYMHFVFRAGLVDFFFIFFLNLKVSFLASGTNDLLYGSNTQLKVPLKIMQQFYHLWTRVNVSLH